MALDYIRQQKLAIACRRGMLELDLLLQPVYKMAIQEFSEEQYKVFFELLHEPDPVIHAWILGTEHPNNHKYDNLIALMQNLNNIGLI